MKWHLAVYSASLGQVTNSDLTAADDGVFNRRNSHLFMPRPFDLIGRFAWGTTATRFRHANTSLITHGIPHIWPIERSLTVQDQANWEDLRDMPVPLPVDEELTIEATTDAIGPAQAGVALWIAAPDFGRQVPRGLPRFTVRGTVVAAAGAENAWNADATMTFERDLMAGVYSVISAHVVAANAMFFRFRFPSQPNVGGKQMRPGSMVQDTIAIRPGAFPRQGMGEWGRFHTRELPNLQFYSDAAGGTYEVRMDVVYMGKDESLLGSF